MKTWLENTKKTENKICYLISHYNIDLLNIESHGPTSAYNDTMYIKGFIPLITSPTRITNSPASLLRNQL